MFKSGYVKIIGETNAGKSTLFNKMVGEKLSQVSPKVQTTRENIIGIYTDDDMQIIFIDSPGVHKQKNVLSKVMNENSLESLNDCDLIVYAVAANKRELSVYDKKIIGKIQESSTPCICILTKVDRVKKNIIEEKVMELKELGFERIILVSVYMNTGIKELKQEIYNLLPEGPKYYDEDQYTDVTVREICEEIIRGKALKFLNQEVPHGIYVEITSFKEGKTKNGEDIVHIDATIYTKKESHKGIIIGKNGSMIKKIGKAAREDMEEFLGKKINLKTKVKVRKNWTDNENIVSRFKS